MCSPWVAQHKECGIIPSTVKATSVEDSAHQPCACPAGSGSALPARARALLASRAQGGASRGALREHSAVVPAGRRRGSLLCEDGADLWLSLRVHLQPLAVASVPNCMDQPPQYDLNQGAKGSNLTVHLRRPASCLAAGPTISMQAAYARGSPLFRSQFTGMLRLNCDFEVMDDRACL